jgi:DNA-binding MarR family transcriptional regulator
MVPHMARSPWLSDEQQQVWRQYILLSRLLSDKIERDMQRAAAMPQAYYLILAMLSEAPGRSLRMNQLAEVLNASQSRTSHAVSRLEEQGWVRRERTPDDGRGQVATLTDEGWDRLVTLAPGHAETVRSAMFDPLDEADLTSLHCAFGKMIKNLQSESAASRSSSSDRGR